ncbi:hypothetical protein Mal64_16040 [Pseudobythopirellula maris]|uniref:Uncharacterized protein n=1 Tax=Pseudobythopirellula maris TaxID=2527991 RepID=A0A5C5ZL21_9BACT|nr:hypothetical protein [Pseudobythopirellula maris]TWT88132.1 hypothetical protein Mal64_16040 [Pseudobythopirellula maris]
MRFTTGWLLLTALVFAVAAAVWTSPLFGVWGEQLRWYYAPGVATFALLVSLALHPRTRKPPLLAGAVLCAFVLLAPWTLHWYAWNVLGDQTANIGLGMLLLALPVLAPVAALCGVLPLGWLVGFIRGRNDQGAHAGLAPVPPTVRQSDPSDRLGE